MNASKGGRTGGPDGDRIRVALPNKGRLSDKAVALLEQAGLTAVLRGDRALLADLGQDFQALFVRAADIPEYVADGAADVGITGADLVAESGREVTEILDLGFGFCRLAVAVRDEAPARSAAELPAGTRVATSFPGVARRYFQSLGIPIEIASVTGATEIAPHLGVADVIVDLVSTGSTLRMNALREVDTIMTSTARLVANPRALRNPASASAIGGLATALESVLRAEAKRYLMANVPRARLEEVRQVIPGINGPTIVEILDGGAWVAAHAVVDAGQVYQTIARLKALGAEGILVTRIERLMP
ncbi:MAG TPA: ATP phosphoribosyltransferase [Longimicrobiales bacterium]|nr:ATP phosphoribosyltransferase [Longimicrobiales bacterium]